MPIVSIDNEDEKTTTGSTTSLTEGSTEKVVIKRSSSAQLRAANKKLQRKRRTSTIIRYTVLTVVGLIMVYPLIWMVGATFKENKEIFTSMNPIPFKATLNGYKNAVKSYGGNINIWKAMLNTYSYVIPGVILTVISSVLTAYGFARFKFIGHKILFAIMMAMLFLPQVVLNVPQYMLFNKLGWIGSNFYLPLIVPTAFAIDTYFIFMLIQFLRGVPKEMEEAAAIDGCGSMKTLVKIIIPMILPAIVSVALFRFMWSSNDFLGPLLYVNTPAKYPATIFVKLSMDSDAGFDWNRVLATSLISIIPNILIFFAAQNQFVEGVSAGGVKG
jgi:oligogalacturonide transport system permease protein